MSTIVTFESVAAAAESLVAAGKRASVRAVIASLGGGSPNAVLNFLQQWKAGRPVIKAAEIAVDPRIATIIAEQISHAVAAARSDIEGQLGEMEQDVVVIAGAGKEAEDLAASLSAQLAEAQAQAQAQAGTIEQLRTMATEAEQRATAAIAQAKADAQAQVDVALATAAKERQEREDVAGRLAVALHESTKVPGLEKAVADLQSALKASETARVAAEQQAAVCGAKLEGVESRLVDLSRRADALSADLGRRGVELSKALGDLADARAQAAGAQARLEAAQHELDGLKKAKPVKAPKSAKPAPAAD